ncbi:hypothetical protein MA16_Dca018610 [Dendrobium catenatum]|uniref:Uncharacterized protein n=1 Tax=Dendrobium catenatum TaxID=906689 RepID=A0A2I0VPH1_9ASPA|nr:hypothetical protein MA16_Dca018610 [Dendrobium catenatum]
MQAGKGSIEAMKESWASLRTKRSGNTGVQLWSLRSWRVRCWGRRCEGLENSRLGGGPLRDFRSWCEE